MHCNKSGPTALSTTRTAAIAIQSRKGILDAEHLLNFDTLINLYLVPFGLKVIAAMAIWIIGGMFINTRQGGAPGADRAPVRDHADQLRQLGHACDPAHPAGDGHPGSVRHPHHLLAAMIGAVGVALGVAWSGLLSNFAAGIFLVVLRLQGG
jgi:small conductance mechanosensitive channel